MKINLSGVSAAENTTTSTFKRVEKGIHNLKITKLEAGQAGSKGTLNVTFESQEAGAEFTHNFFTEGNTPESTNKLLGRIQYLIEKFAGAPLEGDFTIEALSAILVGKSRTCVVDEQIRPRNKDGKWYNNSYPTLRWAGYVDPEGEDATPRVDESRKMDLDAANSASTSTPEAEDSGLPF